MDKKTFDLVKRKIDSHLYWTRKYRRYSNELNAYDDNFIEDVCDMYTGYYKIIEKVYEYKLRQIMNKGQPQLNNDIMFFFKYVVLYCDPDELRGGEWFEREEYVHKCNCEHCVISLNIKSRLAVIHRKYYIYNDELEKKGCKCIDDKSCHECLNDFYYRVRRNNRYQWYINDMFVSFEKEILDFKNI